MENASKALLIAGTFLIAILLLTLFSYLFTQMKEDSLKIVEAINQNEKAEFNQQFLVFDRMQNRIIEYENNDPTKPVYGYLTVQDVASIINLAKDHNKKPKFPTTISVIYNSVNWADSAHDGQRWLIEKARLNEKYDCVVTINNESSLVEKIEIKNI